MQSFQTQTMHAEKTPVRFRHPLQIMGTVPTSVGASCAFLLRIVSTRTDVVDEAICRGLVVGTPTLGIPQSARGSPIETRPTIALAIYLALI